MSDETIIWKPCTCGGVAKSYSRGLEHCANCGCLILCGKEAKDGGAFCEQPSTHRPNGGRDNDGHVYVVRTCCRFHNRNCEPPGDLCCEVCTESAHPGHADGSTCIAPDLSVATG